jgi:hypothetical protein
MIVIVPTRGRPHTVSEMIAAWEQTRTLAHLLFAVDADDPEADTYYKMCAHLPDWAELGLGPKQARPGMVGALNHWAVTMATMDAYSGHIGFMGDDHRPRTFGWDARMQGDHLVYGNDLLQGQNLPTHVVMPAGWVVALGKMCPETLTHLYVDNYWKELGTRVERLRYLPDVIIEHMHPVAGKAAWDDGYKRVNAGEMYHNDAQAYARYVNEGKMDEDVTAVLRSMRSGV